MNKGGIMDKIGFTGSFDPLTNGHLWVIEEALNFAEEVIVFIAVNRSKKPMFSIDERVILIQASTSHLEGRVKVISVAGDYTAQVAKEEYDCDYLIRGIRNAGDFDYESLIQQTNRDVLGGAKTIFVFPPRDLDSVSSSFVKSLVGPVGWHYYVEEFLPSAVINFWVEKEIEKISSAILNEKMTFVDVTNQDSISKTIQNLLKMYSDESRSYHSKSHLLYMLQNIPEEENSLNYIALLLSIFAHDCIMKEENGVSAEERSARYLESILKSSSSDLAAQCVRATEYLYNPDVDKIITLNKEAKILVSLDLAILGSNQAIYKKYAEKVRQEYLKYPEKDYISGRIKALKHLCSIAQDNKLIPYKPLIPLNEKAFKNMSQEIKQLEDKYNNLI